MLPKKHLFDLPEGLIYLDGNSLGVLPRGVEARVAGVIGREWGQSLIRAWNDHGWMEMPRRIGDRVAGLIGAAPGSVVMGDTLSIKVFQALSAGISLRPGRRIVLSDNGNFPSDLYIAQGLTGALGQGLELRCVDPEAVEEAITEDVAVVMLTEVDYRTGRRHDMKRITALAHEKGAVMLWDLAHSAGALDVDLAGSGCEFAVGCSYKYLNGGPGAPAFIYIRPDLAEVAQPILSGWLGHARPFAFDLDYTPAPSVERMRVGTPPILQLAALDAALDVWDGVSMAEIQSRSHALGDLFIREIEARCPMLTLSSPRDAAGRGSQISFRFDHAWEAMQAIIAAGVIGDVRAPDTLRFGFTPLYIGEDDVIEAARRIEQVFASASWRGYIGRKTGLVT